MGAASPLVIAQIASLVVGTGAAAYGVYTSTQQAKFNKQVARNNAVLAENKAQDSIARGRIEERKRRILGQQKLGEQRAAAAGRGVVVDEGSALDLLLDTAAVNEFDIMTIRHNAQREASGFRQQAADFAVQEGLESAAGRNAVVGGLFSIGGTIATGSALVAEKWYEYNKPAEKGA